MTKSKYNNNSLEDNKQTEHAVHIRKKSFSDIQPSREQYKYLFYRHVFQLCATTTKCCLVNFKSTLTFLIGSKFLSQFFSVISEEAYSSFNEIRTVHVTLNKFSMSCEWATFTVNAGKLF